jgi:hypothetical protein
MDGRFDMRLDGKPSVVSSRLQVPENPVLYGILVNVTGYVPPPFRVRLGALDVNVRDLLATNLVVPPSHLDVIVMKAVITSIDNQL